MTLSLADLYSFASSVSLLSFRMHYTSRMHITCLAENAMLPTSFFLKNGENYISPVQSLQPSLSPVIVHHLRITPAFSLLLFSLLLFHLFLYLHQLLPISEV